MFGYSIRATGSFAVCAIAVLAGTAAPGFAQDRLRIIPPSQSQEDMTRSFRQIIVAPAVRPTAVPVTPAAAGPAATAPVPSAVPASIADVSLMLRVEFEFGRATLTPQAQAMLIMVGAAMNDSQLQPYRFLVEGHTDAVGSDEANQRLSERRAGAVVQFLASRGVGSGRLHSIGYGESRTIPGTLPTDAQNRRVEFVRAR